MWNEIIYAFPKFNGAIEVWEWIISRHTLLVMWLLIQLVMKNPSIFNVIHFTPYGLPVLFANLSKHSYNSAVSICCCQVTSNTSALPYSYLVSSLQNFAISFSRLNIIIIRLFLFAFCEFGYDTMTWFLHICLLWIQTNTIILFTVLLRRLMGEFDLKNHGNERYRREYYRRYFIRINSSLSWDRFSIKSSLKWMLSMIY